MSMEPGIDPVAVSIAQAGAALSLGRSTIYRLLESGRLKSVKIGRRTLITVVSIRAVVAELSLPS